MHSIHTVRKRATELAHLVRGGSPAMSVLLPMLLAVPIVLLVLFELELPKKLWALVQPLMQPLVQLRDDGNVPHIGLALQRLERMVTASPSDDRHERSRAQRQA
eukprot:4567820-Prymnesium_polylepis.1